MKTARSPSENEDEKGSFVDLRRYKKEWIVVLETEQIDQLGKCHRTLGSITDQREICDHEFKARPVIMELPQLLVCRHQRRGEVD